LLRVSVRRLLPAAELDSDDFAAVNGEMGGDGALADAGRAHKPADT
jgi:hypothetical protein